MSGISWKKGYRGKGDPEACYRELERIRAAHGCLDRETVKEAARRTDSPLHKDIFDCPPKIASERYYSDKAATVIRSIEIVRMECPKRPSRAYEITTLPPEVNSTPRRVYLTTEEILTDPVARSELLGDAIREVQRLRQRYSMLSELAQVFNAMDYFLINRG